MADKKSHSLGGARNRIAGGKSSVSRSLTSGKFVKGPYTKRNPSGTIKQRSDSGSWQSVETPKPQPPQHDLLEFFKIDEIFGRSDASADKPESRFLTALLRRFTALNLVEVERANGSMDAVVERMLASIPGANVLDDRVGPFYDTAGLKAWFDISKQTLDQQARAGSVLCLLSADGFRLYPSFQFDARGTRLPRLREVLAGLDPEQVDTWGDAVWLNAPADELDGLTPAAALRTDRADEVVELAQQAGAFRLG
ncbi:hypothetical protein [Curtobacterium flaccumfaciens]|uniref:hypothetical protein n=1 Tax=Curtobacterium flaccumfaciens TaxID=2035 RepID=UPI0026581F69|nr:hypothetical protein [Curtobacterium flaccumfaciens]MCS5520756.1 hypothetical protein [Curtobacterium flaccumfaciens]